MRKFKRKYPQPRTKMNIVTVKYGKKYKEWYGWSQTMQEKRDWIEDNIREVTTYFECFESVEREPEDEWIEKKSGYKKSNAADVYY